MKKQIYVLAITMLLTACSEKMKITTPENDARIVSETFSKITSQQDEDAAYQLYYQYMKMYETAVNNGKIEYWDYQDFLRQVQFKKR